EPRSPPITLDWLKSSAMSTIAATLCSSTRKPAIPVKNALAMSLNYVKRSSDQQVGGKKDDNPRGDLLRSMRGGKVRRLSVVQRTHPRSTLEGRCWHETIH